MLILKPLPLSATLLITLLLGGCLAATQEKAEDFMKNFGVQGCAITGLVSGAVTYLITREAKTAAIATAGGCVVGAFIGLDIKQRKDEYASREEAIREELAWNRQFVKEVRTANAQLAKDVQNYSEQLAKLRQEIAQGEATQQDLEEQQEIIAQQNADVKKTLEQVRVALQESQQRYQQYASNGDEATGNDEWKAEIAALEQEKQMLAQYVDELKVLSA